MASRIAENRPTPQMVIDDDDEYAFWRFADLVERRIVNNREDLHQKQKRFGFPKPVRLTAGKSSAALFRRTAVKQWIRQRLAGEV